jgi:hypothetical protein
MTEDQRRALYILLAAAIAGGSIAFLSMWWPRCAWSHGPADPQTRQRLSPVRDVLENGIVVGRIFKEPASPHGRPWMWASGHNGEIRRAADGYEPTREAAMAAFAKSWRRE